MLIGCIQFSPELAGPTATINKLKKLLPQAGAADLLVLPELANSGYNFTSAQQAWQSSEPVNNSRFIDLLAETCAKYNLHIVSGFNERHQDELFNTAVLVGPDGYLGKYQKLHLFFNEKDFFQPGKTGLPIFNLGTYKLGIQICFDWMYPEAWRVLVLEGADIICHTSNLVLPGLAQRAVPIHALINRIFTITANRIGTEGDLTFTGLSTIANPKGEIIAQASAEGQEILLVEIDIEQARDKQITAKNHILDDRLPEEYARLVVPNTKEGR